MRELKFCPSCGTKHLQISPENKMFCTNCGFEMYQNCAAAVAVLLKFNDEVLFTVRNKDPKKGMLDLPGGFCDTDETAEETCKREIFEELQLNISPQKLKYLGSNPNLYLYKEILYHTMDLFYEYELTEKFNPKHQESEIQDTAWINLEDLDLNKLAFESQKKFLQNLNTRLK